MSVYPAKKRAAQLAEREAADGVQSAEQAAAEEAARRAAVEIPADWETSFNGRDKINAAKRLEKGWQGKAVDAEPVIRAELERRAGDSEAANAA